MKFKVSIPVTVVIEIEAAGTREAIRKAKSFEGMSAKELPGYNMAYTTVQKFVIGCDALEEA